LKKKIIIISPNYLPQENGLAMYTHCFAEQCAKFHDVFIITSSDDNIHPVPQDKVFRVVSNWHGLDLLKILKISKKLGADHLLFQYVPYMYSKRAGINFSLPMLILILRLCGRAKIQIMYHELYYPKHFNVKAMILHHVHKGMLFFSALFAHTLYASTEYFQQKILALLPWKKVHHLPVGSNIPKINLSPTDEEELRKTISPEEVRIIGLFGSFHPSKNIKLVLQNLLDIADQQKNIKILYIGATLTELKAEVDSSYHELLKTYIYPTGFLSTAHVGEYLCLLDGMLAYFSDGISTRRGSMLAAMQLGIPILSTQTSYTDSLLLGQDFLTLVNADEVTFPAALKRKISQGWPKNLPADSKEREIAFYKRHFSWGEIVKKFLSTI